MEEKKTQNCPICGTPCEVIDEPYQGDKPVEEIWESFWKPIVSNEDGTINIEQVKKELADFSFVMEQVPKVYCHITKDMMSKVMYKAEDVIRMADDHFNEALREAIKEETESVGAAWVKANIVKILEWASGFCSENSDQLMLDDNEWYVTMEDEDEPGTRNCKSVTADDLAELYLLHHPDESRNAPAPLTQSRADFIREANNRDLGGVADTREEDAEKSQFDNWHRWLSDNGYTYDGEYYYDQDNNYFTPDQLWGKFK